MSIAGSVSNYFASAGSYEITLPKKGLTVVGLSLSNQVMSIPISSGRTAYFMGAPAGTYVFQPVTFLSDSGILNVTLTGGALVIIYYGTPYPNSPSLSAYAGVYQGISITIPASISTLTNYTASATLNFPANATKLTGFEYSGNSPATSVSSPSLITLGFPVSTGESLYMAVPAGGINAGFIPDFGTLSGILPLSIGISTSLSVTLSGYFTNSSTSSVIVYYDVVLYYA